MVEDVAAVEALRALRPGAAPEHQPHEVARELAEHLEAILEASAGLPFADEVGLMLLDPYGRLGPMGTTGPASRILGELQRELGEGPSLAAVVEGDVVVVGDPGADPRWPELARLLGPGLVRAALSVPVHAGGRPVGTLELVALGPRQVDAADLDGAGAMADAIAGFLEAAAIAADLAGRVGQLERAQAGRDVLEQARGVLMERAGLAAPAAFEELRARARAAGRPLADVAAALVAEAGGRGSGAAGADEALEVLTGLALARPPAERLVPELPAPLLAVAGADAVAVELLDGDELVTVAASGLGPDAVGRRAPSDAGLAGQAAQTAAPLFVTDLPAGLADPVLAPALDETGAAGAVPVLRDGEPVGAVVVAKRAPGPFPPQARDRLVLAAGRVAAALAGAEAGQAAAVAAARAELATDRLRRLRAVSAALSGAATAADVVRAVVREGVAVLDGRAGVVAVPDPDEPDQLQVAGWTGYDEDAVRAWARFPLSAQVPLAEAARSGEPVWVHDAGEWDRRFPATGALRRSQASAALPLRAHGRFLGSFGLSFDRPQTFDEADRLYLQILADEGAQALERAQLYELASRERDQAAAAQQRLAFLAEASALLATSLDLQVTMDQIAWLAVPKLADLGIVLLVDRDHGVLRPTAIASEHGSQLERVRRRLADGRLRLEAPGLVTDALRVGRARRWAASGPGGGPPDAHEALLAELDVTAAMLVPLVGRPERLGMILLGRQGGGRPYTADDVSLAEDLAVRAGTALDNARRFDAQAARPPEPT